MNRSISRLSTSRWGPCAVVGTVLLADHLCSVGIPVTLDLPGVGANLQDHPKSQVAYSTTRPVRTGTFARKPHVLARIRTDGPPNVQMIFIEAAVAPRWTPCRVTATQ